MLDFVHSLYLDSSLPLSDTLRKQAWPKLVGLNCVYEAENPKHSGLPRGRPGVPRPSARDLPPRMPAIPQNRDGSALMSVAPKKRTMMTVPGSDDAEQIDRDVARCTWHLLTGSQRSRRLQMKNKHRKKMGVLIKKKQKRLGNLINLTLLQTYGEDGTDRLKYYQGYHDIASIVLGALGGGAVPLSTDERDSESPHAIAGSIGLDLPARVLAQVSQSHLRDPMRDNFQELQTALKLTIFPLISAFDPEVHDHLWECEMSPFFCLSWILTWFSHDIRDTALVTRLFDAFLVSHPLLSIYVAVAMVCHPLNRAEILNTECDFSELHQVLAALPKNSSMVGWKYRPGDGYVSGEDDSEDATVSTDMDVSFFDEDPLEGRDDEESDTQSMISQMGYLGKEARVPFQELIDNAISYMRRIPPRKILALAKHYYGNEMLMPMMAHTQNISLLQPPPRWALLATLPADWVLKQRMRELGSRSATRRARRCRSRSRSKTRSDAKTESEPSPEKEKFDGSVEKPTDGQVPPNSDKEDEIEKYLKEQAKSLAVIACGFGPCEEDERQRRRKARKFLIWSGVAIAIVAISVAVMMKYGMSPNSESKQFQRDMLADTINTSATGSSRDNSEPPPKIKHVPVFGDGSTATVQSKSQGAVEKTLDVQSPAPVGVVDGVAMVAMKRVKSKGPSASKKNGSRGPSSRDASPATATDKLTMVAKVVIKSTRSSTRKEGQTPGEGAMASAKTAMKAKTKLNLTLSMEVVSGTMDVVVGVKREKPEIVATSTTIATETITTNSIESKLAKTDQGHQQESKQKTEIMNAVHILADAVPATKEAIKFVVTNFVRDVREAFRDSDAVGEL